MIKKQLLKYILYSQKNSGHSSNAFTMRSKRLVFVYLIYLRHALIYTVFDGMVEKLQVSASQNFLQIENQLNIEEVMSKNVCICSFPIFEFFDIHSITALRCI